MRGGRLREVVAKGGSTVYTIFPLLTTYSAFEILLKTYSFNDVNSGKLYILDLLYGSIASNKDLLIPEGNSNLLSLQ